MLHNLTACLKVRQLLRKLVRCAASQVLLLHGGKLRMAQDELAHVSACLFDRIVERCATPSVNCIDGSELSALQDRIARSRVASSGSQMQSGLTKPICRIHHGPMGWC